MQWEQFCSKLNMGRSQEEGIKNMLDHYKDQYAELCMRASKESRKSPIEYAAGIQIEYHGMDREDFNKRLLSFLSRERGADSDLTYVDAGFELDLSVRKRMTEFLDEEQMAVFESLGIESMLDIQTGHDPFSRKLLEEIEKQRKSSIHMNNKPFFSETFCIMPWIHILIDKNGVIKPCCYTTDVIKDDDGRNPLFLQNESLSEIWNSFEMREIRRKMVAGEKSKICISCDDEEEMGQVSRRYFYNNAWLFFDRDRDKWRQRVQDSINDNLYLTGPPVYYTLLPGNLCNLKCRMCNPGFSSSIERDPVQNVWNYLDDTNDDVNPKWFESDWTINKLIENVGDIRMLHLIGGEPLLNPTIKKLLDILIERDVSNKTSLEFSTNLTVYLEEFWNKLDRFESVLLMLSIDGVGPVFEYIRYPAKWTEVMRNLKNIILNPKLQCRITATIQNCNVLDITDLLEFAESMNLPVNLNILHAPEYLNIRVMPEKARLLAARRLKEFKDRSAMVKGDIGMASTLANVIQELEHDSEEYYHKHINEFIIFTNDLDRSRNQSFRDTLPELYNYIIEDGIIWTEEVRHCSPQSE